MCSLGVMDLDLSLSPDAFGLRAFDHGKSLTRMLPGSTPCELRLMLPDSMLGSNGFHDVLIDNMAASPSWLSGHVSPTDMTVLRRRLPKAVFKTMRRHAQEMERLRRGARHRPDRAFRHNAPGFCPVCDVRIESALDVHMLNFHLELAQLWHWPVEWCAVWKGFSSVRACLEHLTEKHGVRHSGAPPGQVPADCYPGVLLRTTDRVRVLCRSPRTLRCWAMFRRQCVRRNMGC